MRVQVGGERVRHHRTVRAAGVVAACVGLALVGAPVVNWADNEINVHFHAFQDTRGVTVLAPAGDLSMDFTDRTSLKVKFGVDAVSSASDSCARCHQGSPHDTRRYIDASITRKYGDTKLTLGTEVSIENFYGSNTLMASATRDINKGNTTIAGGYSFSWNRPQLHPSPTTRNQYSHDAYVSVTQTLTKTTIAQVTYEYNRISGFQASPFLRAKVNGTMMVGNSPDLRSRHTLALRLRQALPGDTYLEADVRHYFDDWSIKSNTVELGLSHYFSPSTLVAVNYRRYTQTGAFFYQPQYVGMPLLFTGDFRLAPFDSNLFGGRVSFTPKGGLFGLLPSGTGLTFQYDRYVANNGFQAAIFSTGIRIPFGSK
jgi:hypothetical protein